MKGASRYTHTAQLLNQYRILNKSTMFNRYLVRNFVYKFSDSCDSIHWFDPK